MVERLQYTEELQGLDYSAPTPIRYSTPHRSTGSDMTTYECAHPTCAFSITTYDNPNHDHPVPLRASQTQPHPSLGATLDISPAMPRLSTVLILLTLITLSLAACTSQNNLSLGVLCYPSLRSGGRVIILHTEWDIYCKSQS